jgi:ABC-type multidrug transport system ATPase subunit
MTQEPLEKTELDEKPTVCPTLSFETITFSDGVTLTLQDDDIVVFVGPNNAGKSAALRELEMSVARQTRGAVITSTTLRKHGTAEDLRSFLELNAQKTLDHTSIKYRGFGYEIHHGHVDFFDGLDDRHPVAPFFASRLSTESRIHASNAAGALALYQQPPNHPIHMLLMDENLASDISDMFRKAFGKDLIPFRAGGGSFPLYVGAKPSLKPGKDELSREFVEELQRSNVTLDSQGDGMRSFASVLLFVLVSETRSIQFLDEPEAFLHPPQARLLGRFIAEKRRNKSQLFIATHSTEILDGLIDGGLDKIRIVRLRRENNVNYVKELGKTQTQTVAKDTLTRFSRVFDGIFFEHVVCESDADCMFYQSLLNLSSISGERRPDILFVHAAGKARMAKLADTLRSLDVPVSVVADIDILNDEKTFKNLFETLGGVWPDAQPHWKALSNDIIARKPPMNATRVKNMIANEIQEVTGTGEFPRDKENAIKQIFRAVSPWSALKQSGRAALRGEPVKQFDKLNDKCAAVGLWIVPVGEIEGFCSSVGVHGPGFVEKVLEERNLETDEELKEAREFVSKIWQRACQVEGRLPK